LTEHYDEPTLGDYLDDPEHFPDREALQRHLAECGDCRKLLDDLEELENALHSSDLWGAADALRITGEVPPDMSALAATLTNESDAADKLLAPFIHSPIAFRRAKVPSRPEMRTAGVVRALCNASRDLREKQPMHALALADTAVALSDQLPRELYPSILIGELRGGAWLERANVLRYLGRFNEALDALDIAEKAFTVTSVATFSVALAQYLRAVIFFKTERLDEATRLARRSARIFRHFGEEDRFIHAKIVEAGVLFLRNDFAGARDIFASLVNLAKEIGDAATLARLYGNIANCDLRVDELSEASSYFAQALSLYEALGLETEKIRTRWSLGRLLLKSGRGVEGINSLRETRREFEQIGLTSDGALVTLDIVGALLASGDNAEAARLCAGLAESFISAGMTGNALTALAYLREAVGRGNADARLVEHVREYLERRTPDRPFVPPE